MASTEIGPDALRSRLEAGEELFFLDVREPEEVAEWAFPGAVNIPLGQLEARRDEIPVDRAIVVACHSGMRSTAAAHALTSGGWRAQNLTGGAVAWQATERSPRSPEPRLGAEKVPD